MTYANRLALVLSSAIAVACAYPDFSVRSTSAGGTAAGGGSNAAGGAAGSVGTTGATSIGGASNGGAGGTTATGGSTGTGGLTAVGGNMGAGGSSASSGTTSAGTTGGASSTGGAGTGMGGALPTGGAAATGGTTNTGGSTASTGGTANNVGGGTNSSTGGTVNTGGGSATGGTFTTGGTLPTGGTTATAGGTGAGGASSSGGTGGIPDAGGGAAAKRVFVTTSTSAGNFGGVSVADGICQQEAVAAALNGVYLAWVADSVTSPLTRFTQSQSGYVRVDGVQVAADFASLTDGTLDAPINTTAGGAVITGEVWTNVAFSPYTPLGSCGDWTSADGTLYGLTGDASGTDESWTASWIEKCYSTRYARFYCFEQ
jgi:hypothetical protein